MKASQTSAASGHPSVDLVVDGTRATLLEVSATHALVHCEKPLKPEHRVRVVLRANELVLRLRAMVVSAKFEMPKEGPRYRVQLQFEGDTAGIEKILE